MTSEDIQKEIDRLEAEIVQHKAEIYDRLQAIGHLKTVQEVMAQNEGSNQ